MAKRQKLKAGRELPTKKETSKAVEKVTGQKKRGRPPATHDRVKFTTLLEPKKRDTLKMIALLEHKTISDIFEEAADYIIQHYKKKYPDNLK